jgi:DNA-binding IclR family transcriptional regulator
VESVSNVGVLDKAIGVLRAIEHEGPQGLVDLQSLTGLPRATLHRLAVALERHGLLRRDQAGRFCLGLGLVALGHVAGETFPIAALSRPRLAELCQHTGESVQLYVRDGDRRRCAVSFPSPHGLRWMVGEGALLPLHLGSAGRVLTGQLGPLGWVETVEEREPGVASVSAPISGHSTGVLAAVSVGGPIERLTRTPGKRFGGDVVAAADDIAATL